MQLTGALDGDLGHVVSRQAQIDQVGIAGVDQLVGEAPADGQGGVVTR